MEIHPYIVILVLAFSFDARAGVHEWLADWIANPAASCPASHAEKESAALKRLEEFCNTKSSALPFDIAPKTTDAGEILERGYFDVLGGEARKTLRCNAHVALNLMNTNNGFIADLKSKSVAIAELDQKIGEKSGVLQLLRGQFSQNQQAPGYADQPKKKIYEEGQESLRKLAAMRNLIIGSIPGGSHEEIGRVLKSLADPNVAAFSEKMRRRVSDAYGTVESDLRKSASKLDKAKANGWDRDTREALMQNRELVGAVLEKVPESQESLKPLTCRMDARYGSGARMRDTSMAMGSMLVGGGAFSALRVGSVAWAARSSTAAVVGTRALQASAASIIGVDASRQIEKACRKRAPTWLSAPNDKGCQSTEMSLATVEHHNCLLTLGLNALGLEMSTGLLRKTAELLRGGSKMGRSTLARTMARYDVAHADDLKSTAGIEVEMQMPSTFSSYDMIEKVTKLLKDEGAEIVEAGVVGESFPIIHYKMGGEAYKLKMLGDASIKESARHIGVEVVSPVLRNDKDFETFAKVIQLMEKNGGRIHPTAGVHVHVGFGSAQAGEVVALQEAFAHVEDGVTKAFSQLRSRQGFAAPMNKDEIKTLIDRTAQSPAALTVTPGKHSNVNVENWLRKLLPNVDARYKNLNTQSLGQHGTVEFRIFNSTLDMESLKKMKSFSESFVSAVRTKDDRLVSYIEGLGRGEKFSMPDLMKSIGLQTNDPKVNEVFSKIASEARSMRMTQLPKSAAESLIDYRVSGGAVVGLPTTIYLSHVLEKMFQD